MRTAFVAWKIAFDGITQHGHRRSRRRQPRRKLNKIQTETPPQIVTKCFVRPERAGLATARCEARAFARPFLL